MIENVHKIVHVISLSGLQPQTHLQGWPGKDSRWGNPLEMVQSFFGERLSIRHDELHWNKYTGNLPTKAWHPHVLVAFFLQSLQGIKPRHRRKGLVCERGTAPGLPYFKTQSFFKHRRTGMYSAMATYQGVRDRLGQEKGRERA